MTERVEMFRRKVSENPENPLFRFSLGQALFNEGSFAEAEKSFVWCLKKRSDWMLALLLRGRCLIELERTEEAKTTLRLAVQVAREQDHEDPEREAIHLLEQLEEKY